MPFALGATGRWAIAIVAAAALAAGLAGCTSGPPSPTGSPTPRVPTARFTGAATGTLQMHLCTAGGSDSIFIHFAGDSKRYAGSVNAHGMVFIGQGAVPWAQDVARSATLPAYSGDGKTVTLDGITVYSSKDTTKSLVFTGEIACP
jgi:hypothetical protein